ncbi:hypothetical protein V8G54_020446 [Vigna mungo]|uniref:Uncharacterized protein n=1 Tax=Vigna mungo TaxID=3915 RepID=A0AAQ3NC88_VIGMU
MPLVVDVEGDIREGCMSPGIPILWGHNNGELGLEQTSIVISKKVKVSIVHTYHRHSITVQIIATSHTKGLVRPFAPITSFPLNLGTIFAMEKQHEHSNLPKHR